MSTLLKSRTLSKQTFKLALTSTIEVNVGWNEDILPLD